MKAKQYEHLFFDLDHTLWDFDTNSEATLRDLYAELKLDEKATVDFDQFHKTYQHHNSIYWDRFRKGYINREELRWRRMWRTLVDYKITDEPLSKKMSDRYLDILPTKTNLFPHCMELLNYCSEKKYPMHLITNGFEATQHLKIKNSGISHFFKEVITSEQAGIMKPHAAIFEYALNKTNTTAEKSIMVGGDTAYFNPAVPHTPKIKPTYVIQNLGELMKIF
jgi:putative hydrolase of the HAD superfamily